MRPFPILASALLAASPVAAQDARTFTLLGRVLEYQTDAPVAGALVQVEPLGRRALSDSAGWFVLRDLPEGEHTFVTSRLGYATNSEASEVRAGQMLTVRLLPRPILLEGIEAMADGFARRERTHGFTVRGYDRRDLLSSTASNVAEFLRYRARLVTVGCPYSPFATCAIVRGRPRRLSVYLDDAPMTGDASLLEMFGPEEMYRVEVYPGLGMVRLYTVAFAEHLARNGRPPAPICIVC